MMMLDSKIMYPSAANVFRRLGICGVWYRQEDQCNTSKPVVVGLGLCITGHGSHATVVFIAEAQEGWPVNAS